MSALMTLASILAAALLLSVLAVGLLLIVKVLQSVRGYLEQIAMGVRAIEKQSEAIPTGMAELVERFSPLAGDLQRAAERLDVAGRGLERRRTSTRD